jgi:preprotein translocase subunit SecA
MHDLRQNVSLRAYGQVNPVDEYKKLGFDMFEAMISGIKEEVVRRIFTVRIRKEASVERKSVMANFNAAANAGGDSSVKKQPVKKDKKPGRNDPCPCGKWKEDGSRPLKYKECCGK